MSQALRKLTSIISRSRTIVVFINQIRMKIGVMFGNPGDHDRRQRADSSIRRSASPTFGASARSRAAPRMIPDRAPRSKWSRTRWRRRSARPNSTSCTAPASRRRASLVDMASEHNIIRRSFGAWYSLRRRAHRAGTGKCARPAQSESADRRRNRGQAASQARDQTDRALEAAAESDDEANRPESSIAAVAPTPKPPGSERLHQQPARGRRDSRT